MKTELSPSELQFWKQTSMDSGKLLHQKFIREEECKRSSACRIMLAVYGRKSWHIFPVCRKPWVISQHHPSTNSKKSCSYRTSRALFHIPALLHQKNKPNKKNLKKKNLPITNGKLFAHSCTPTPKQLLCMHTSVWKITTPIGYTSLLLATHWINQDRKRQNETAQEVAPQLLI